MHRLRPEMCSEVSNTGPEPKKPERTRTVCHKCLDKFLSLPPEAQDKLFYDRTKE
jgi:hypothetical protein